MKKTALLIGLGLLSLLKCPAVNAEALPPQPGQPGALSVLPSPVQGPLRLSETGELTELRVRPSRIASVRDRDQRSVRLWQISVASMVAASAFDAITSMNKPEANSLLRSSNGTFGARGISIKAALTGVSLASQFMLRDRPECRKMFTVVNFIETGAFVGIASHNLGIKPVR